jgi:uncharacterized SAM-binding protein YcdF (DUF218 family)
LKRFIARSAVILAPMVLVAGVLLYYAGGWLVVEDPLEKADAIFVLSGTRLERPLEAYDLYKEGWAPRIMLFRVVSDYGEAELMKRGFEFPLESDVQQDVLRRLGMPEGTVAVLSEEDSTRDEALEVRAAAVANGWKTIIIVTSKQHTRRARLVVARRLAGTDVKVIMRASRYDLTDAAHWWRNRATVRFTLFELQRWFGYWIGVAD